MQEKPRDEKYFLVKVMNNFLYNLQFLQQNFEMNDFDRDRKQSRVRGKTESLGKFLNESSVIRNVLDSSKSVATTDSGHAKRYGSKRLLGLTSLIDKAYHDTFGSNHVRSDKYSSEFFPTNPRNNFSKMASIESLDLAYDTTFSCGLRSSRNKEDDVLERYLSSSHRRSDIPRRSKSRGSRSACEGAKIEETAKAIKNPTNDRRTHDRFRHSMAPHNFELQKHDRGSLRSQKEDSHRRSHSLKEKNKVRKVNAISQEGHSSKGIYAQICFEEGIAIVSYEKLRSRRHQVESEEKNTNIATGDGNRGKAVPSSTNVKVNSQLTTGNGTKENTSCTTQERLKVDGSFELCYSSAA
jgi:hypothetical protein